MKRKECFWWVFAIIGVCFLSIRCSNVKEDYCCYVNPFIGNADNGHTFPGACVPFGMIQVSPESGNGSWRYCSGFNIEDDSIMGFSQNHLNGTGCPDLGDILILPFCGDIQNEKYKSRYEKEHQKAHPGYYSVVLSDFGVEVELTATQRTAMHRYTFRKAEPAHILVDLQSGIVSKNEQLRTHVIDAEVQLLDQYSIVGKNKVKMWVEREFFYVIKFDKPYIAIEELQPQEGEKAKRLLLSFDLKPGENVQVKVGLSTVSIEGAQEALEKENPDWNFEKVKAQSAEAWNNLLSRIDVSGTEEQKVNFYTSIYHLCIQPNNITDVDGRYRGPNDSILYSPIGEYYSTLSLWDTYRAAHPLYTLVQPERVPDFINSMLAIYEQQGRLPVWHLFGSDTNEMIGIQSVPVIADAILKDVKGFNYERAYQAMKASMMSDYKGLSYVTDLEYIPADKENESVAKGLEYAIADWEVAQVARKLGKTEDYEYFSKRALAYQNYWDKDTHFFRGKNRDGSWVTPFNPVHSTHRNDAYCEGNGWQYTWLVPHDVEGLISLFGSKEAFVSKLDSLFLVNEDLGDAASPDISGLIGQYAHGNEPGHHTVYLYSFVGQQWKTAEKVDYILSHMYSDLPDGLQGNEDCGQMSSWYVFSALGFYPVNPSDGMYVFGRPIFDKVVLKLPENKVFEIRANNNSAENKYIQSIELNGQPYNKLNISHADIMAGGTLVFTMGNRPNEQFGMITQSSVETDIN